MTYPPKQDRDEVGLLAEQAIRWWTIMNDEPVANADRQQFASWVSRSPERIGAYLRVERLMRALHKPEVSWPDISAQELVRQAKASASDVVPLPAVRTTQPAPNISWKAWSHSGPGKIARLALGAAAALVVAVALHRGLAVTPQQFTTQVGEQHSMVLSDGSLVTLNTDSKIEVELQPERRVIKLVSGEAMFEVAHDKSRPFDVIVGNTVVRAVGTQFNVDRRAARTTVTVLEGRVLVDDVPVSAGQSVSVTEQGVTSPERLANLASAIAWTQRRLVFEHRSLGEVADEFNRYNQRQIHIEDAALRRQEVTGTFQANDPGAFLTFLSRIPGVSVREAADGTHWVAAVASGTTERH